MVNVTDDQIYAAYPRKVAPIAAKKAIAKAVRSYALEKSVDVDTARKRIYDAVCKFAASPAGQKGQFTPHCSTFFNQGRYMDDPAEWYVTELAGEPYSARAQVGMFVPSPDDKVWDGEGYVTRREWEQRRIM